MQHVWIGILHNTCVQKWGGLEMDEEAILVYNIDAYNHLN